ncbi:MAG: HPr family phosphocarrier protein [Propionibacteriaceae bacterium]|jgi:phosphocarrier protein|nr:HPr family phosphocarrier protein [Propionibacteriaceae bacterium]
MAQRKVVVASSLGIHARPAAMVVKEVSRLGLPVQIAKPGEAPVDASNILTMMCLGVQHGDEVVLFAEGEGADAALDSLVGLLSTDLDAV